MNEKIKDSLNSNTLTGISTWQNKYQPLNESLHVKYNPAERTAKNHLSAIMADVGENTKKMKDFLDNEIKIRDILSHEESLIHQLEGLEGLSFSNIVEVKKEKETPRRLKKRTRNGKRRRKRKKLAAATN